jgi:hypothetical protein
VCSITPVWPQYVKVGAPSPHFLSMDQNDTESSMEIDRRSERCTMRPSDTRRRTLAKKYTTGGNCDAWCTKCKLDLAHTIHAMVDDQPVKVECNTCHGIHKYRPTAAVKEAAKAAAKAERARRSSGTRKTAPKAPPIPTQWREAMERLHAVDQQRYSVKGLFEVDHIIDHSKFGVGVVVKILEPTRVRVIFRDEERTMVMGLGR